MGVRQRAAEALTKIRDATVVEALNLVLEVEDRYSVRADAVRALAEIRTKRAIEIVIGALADARVGHRGESIDVSGVAGDCLSAIGEAVVEPLIEVLKEEDPLHTASVTAARALARIGDLRAVKPLIRALKSKYSSIRREAVEALWDIGDVRAVEPLVECLSDWDWSVGEVAARALQEFKWKPRNQTEMYHYLMRMGLWDEIVKAGEPAVDPLIKFLMDFKGALAGPPIEEAAEALGKIGDARAVESLTEVLGGLGLPDGQGTIEAVIDALGRIGDPRPVEPLVHLALIDKWPTIREKAVEALANIIRDERAIQLLTKASEDKDPRGRHARTALQELQRRGLKNLKSPIMSPLERTS